MNSPSDDKAFEEYLGRRSAVSQAYRDLPSDDVPAHLDQQILAQARAAIGGSGADELARVRAKRRRLMRWGVPAAIAASALLVVSIVIRSGVEHEVRSADFSPAAKPAPTNVPAIPEARQESAGAAAEESVVMIAPPRDAVTEFSSYARTPPPRSDKAPEQPVIESPPVAVAVPAPAPAPPPPQYTAMQERTEAAAVSREQEVQRAVMAQRKEAAKAASAPPVAARSIAASANEADMALNVARLHADPDDWLEHIRQLRRDGQQSAADREWKQFQETYPEHPVAEADLARAKSEPAR